MKFTSTLVVAALLSGNEVEATRLSSKKSTIQFAQLQDQIFNDNIAKYKNMPEKDLFAMVEKKAKEEPKKEEKSEEAVAKDAEAKAIEKIVAQRIWDRVGGYGYPTYGYYPYYYPYGPDIAHQVATLQAYHDVIARAAAINAVAGMVSPSADAALKILEGTLKPQEPPKEAPKDKAAVQLNMEGPPVLIDPQNLLVNEMHDVDLGQRDFIVDGINGIDFVQTKAEGVPVYVNPTLLPNECTDCDLAQKDFIIDGINGIDFVQLNNLQRPSDDVVLQVHGTPVTVNPESMLRENTMARQNLGLSLEVGYNTESLNLLQTGAQISTGNPVVNPPFNNWSVNQPSPPHATGDNGHQDLELRDLIIEGVNGYDLVQTKAE